MVRLCPLWSLTSRCHCPSARSPGSQCPPSPGAGLPWPSVLTLPMMPLSLAPACSLAQGDELRAILALASLLCRANHSRHYFTAMRGSRHCPPRRTHRTTPSQSTSTEPPGQTPGGALGSSGNPLPGGHSSRQVSAQGRMGMPPVHGGFPPGWGLTLTKHVTGTPSGSAASQGSDASEARNTD